MICSKYKLHAELEKLKTIFLDNGYPEDDILSYTKEKIASFSAIQKFFGYSKVPSLFEDSGYVGRTTQRLGDRIKHHIPSNIRNKTAPQREQPP